MLFRSKITTSLGDLILDASSDLVQVSGNLTVTGNLTVSGFSNFVTSVVKPNNGINYQTDTVTLILDQGTTGNFGVTLPSGTAYKYAGAGNTVATTANTVTMVSVTGYYNPTTSATGYLLTVSPGFQ